jgi:hypothetical protein
LTIYTPVHRNTIDYGLNLSSGRGHAATFANGLRKNRQDYVKLLFKRTTSVKKDSSYTFYLADYDPTAKRFTGSSLNQAVTVCFDSGNPNPAIEITLVKTDSVRKYVIDPDNVITNSYQTAGTCPVDPTLERSYTIPGSEIESDSRLLMQLQFRRTARGFAEFGIVGIGILHG